jgi:hypothetical protein
VCENGKVVLRIAPQLFFSSNRTKKLYKNIAHSQRKVSRIRPQKAHFFEKIRKHGARLVEKSLFENRKIQNLKSDFGCLGWVRKSKKWVKMGSFLRLDPLEKRFEGKNSPDFYVANASIFGPNTNFLSELWHFLFFRNPENFLGRCSKLSAVSPRCFWADF